MFSRTRRRRVTRVVEALTSARVGGSGWPLATIAQECGLSPTAASMALQELVEAGWAHAAWTVSNQCPDGSDGPARRHYFLTVRGRARAMNALATRHSPSSLRAADVVVGTARRI